MMKRAITTVVLGLLISLPVWASGTHYEMRVDGLACPYCAYGVEKKLNAIDGVQDIDVDLNAGLVKVDVNEGVELTEAAMKKLFNDAGFTLRSIKIGPSDQALADQAPAKSRQ